MCNHTSFSIEMSINSSGSYCNIVFTLCHTYGLCDFVSFLVVSVEMNNNYLVPVLFSFHPFINLREDFFDGTAICCWMTCPSWWRATIPATIDVKIPGRERRIGWLKDPELTVILWTSPQLTKLWHFKHTVCVTCWRCAFRLALVNRSTNSKQALSCHTLGLKCFTYKVSAYS